MSDFVVKFRLLPISVYPCSSVVKVLVSHIPQSQAITRARPDGRVLRWKSFGLQEDYDALLPFFIEWNRDSVHPSQDAPEGCKLLQFSAESPSSNQVADSARKLGLNFNVTPGKNPLLHARISGKKGEFELA